MVERSDFRPATAADASIGAGGGISRSCFAVVTGIGRFGGALRFIFEGDGRL